jgi:hypothetical protein
MSRCLSRKFIFRDVNFLVHFKKKIKENIRACNIFKFFFLMCRSTANIFKRYKFTTSRSTQLYLYIISLFTTNNKEEKDKNYKFSTFNI